MDLLEIIGTHESSGCIPLCKPGSRGTDFPKSVTENWRLPSVFSSANSPRMCQPKSYYAGASLEAFFGLSWPLTSFAL